ncbi:MAG: class I SAM-dependent methyltransferase [Magnetococcales bacterium]|nr:class I SAM-dependent methyltransferase [Magnetococcales bacterium]
MTSSLTCRFCHAPLNEVFVDLGTTPLANTYLTAAQLQQPELVLPLCCYVCSACLLVQLPSLETPEHIFSDYAYFSSYSDSWLEHARLFCQTAIERFRIDSSHLVMEIASNDGYLLRNFVAAGVPVLGIEPAANVAVVAQQQGIPTLVRFFGRQLAQELVQQGQQADLLIGNNVLAHVPDLNDFVAGLRLVLKPTGVLVMEFPHLLQLMQHNQFDTIYHEHFSYFSFTTVRQIFAHHGLTLFDVEQVATHGGSLRIYACVTPQSESASAHAINARVELLLQQERDAALHTLTPYQQFGQRAVQCRQQLRQMLTDLKSTGHRTVGYGAPAKGNTLLNYCGIGSDLIDYTVDRSPHKQGLFLPGSHLAILAPEQISVTKPDFVIILPWNLQQEIMTQLAFIRQWGGQFIIPIPTATVLP